MKGLLIKDFYTLKKKFLLILIFDLLFLVMTVISVTDPMENIGLSVYPILLIGVLPVSFTSYDEKMRWTDYSTVLPYSKKEIVSSKYISGLIMSFSAIIIQCTVQSLKMCINHIFSIEKIIIIIQASFIIGVVVPSITLTFIFAFGFDKGKIAYYITVGILGAIGGIAVNLEENDISFILDSEYSVPAIMSLSVIIYAVSWFLSVKLYEKREL